MPMDQQAFHDLGDFDENEVDLGAAPQSAEHYLKQVCIQRRQVGDVSIAARVDNMAPTQNTNTSTASEAPTTSGSTAASNPAAPREWQDKQINDFLALRQRMAAQRHSLQERGKLAMLACPEEEDDDDVWQSFCEEVFPETQEKPSGEPSRVFGLTQPAVCSLIAYNVDWLCEHGYNTTYMHRLFSLLLVLEPPLDPDTCANLRELARYCRSVRVTCESGNANSSALAREYSWFIAIVGRFFGQKDLADP